MCHLLLIKLMCYECISLSCTLVLWFSLQNDFSWTWDLLLESSILICPSGKKKIAVWLIHWWINDQPQSLDSWRGAVISQLLRPVQACDTVPYYLWCSTSISLCVPRRNHSSSMCASHRITVDVHRNNHGRKCWWKIIKCTGAETIFSPTCAGQVEGSREWTFPLIWKKKKCFKIWLIIALSCNFCSALQLSL